jgi:hypothetical protein
MGDHLIVLHSAVRACPGYSRHDAPSMLMVGSSIARDTEHGQAMTAQLTRRHARTACEDYFYNRLELTPDYELGGPETLPDGLELLSDPMYRALEDIVELVVEGDYEELSAVSGNRLDVEDLRRRVEDDCPEAHILPPREAYRVEAITLNE